MATKGNNKSRNTKSKSSSNSRSRSNTKSKASTKAKKQREVEEFDDPFFEDSAKEIVLWASIALCVLLLISNIGVGGTVGNAVANFLFGVFGIVQYILPFLISFSAFFIISNYGNKVAIAKVIAGFVLTIFISVFVELFIHGAEAYGALNSFYYGFENHNGGGFIGGGIAFRLIDSFDLFGSYLITLIVIAVSVIIIIERFAFDKVQRSSQYHADRAAAKRRDRRERQMMEREANQTRFNNERTAIQKKLEEDRLLQAEQESNNTGKRSSRKRTGVTSNTTINPIYDGVNQGSNDGVNEIRFNMGDGTDGTVDITETSRHKLTSSDRSSSSSHNFKETPTVTTPVEPVAEPVKEITPSFAPVINTPVPTASTSAVSGSELMAEAQENANNTPETMRHAKPSVSNEKEIEASSENMRKSIESEKAKPKKPYRFPPLNLLNEPRKTSADSKQYLNDMAGKLQRTLSNFGVEAEVKEVTLGPAVTQYKIQIDQGTKVSKVLNLTDDIKLNMAVTDVRIEAPIPGEPYIGIEVPNKEKTMVGFKELVSSSDFKNAKSKISFCVGKDIGGKVIVGNIEKMPHLLIAGATGSGKSVCINTIIMSILYHASPDDVKLIMVDPKMVELSVYNGIPHLLIPVVTDAKKAAGALHWAVKEMTDRYELLALAGVRNIESFNEKVEQDALGDEIPENRRERMPQIVIVLDELADLMMVAAADVEDSIVRLAQLARAAGIHLIIATQRPTSNVITGLIKANVPSRIAFSVSSGIDSRVILDMNGAEDLLGNGDMLYAPQNLSKPVRIQGAFVSEEEVAKVVDFLKNNNDTADYNSAIEEQIQNIDSSNGSVSISGEPDNSRDALFAEAGRLVIENNKGSIGYLQRNFRIGFNRAARIMDQLAEAGVVGPEMGTKPREIRMSISQFEEYINQ